METLRAGRQVHLHAALASQLQTRANQDKRRNSPRPSFSTCSIRVNVYIHLTRAMVTVRGDSTGKEAGAVLCAERVLRASYTVMVVVLMAIPGEAGAPTGISLSAQCTSTPSCSSLAPSAPAIGAALSSSRPRILGPAPGMTD